MHGWLAWLGVVAIPGRAFWDVDLYRWWATLALDGGRWPVLDDPWVYPAGALVPVLAPALTGARSTVDYAAGWSVGITVLDALAVAVLLRAGRRRRVPAGAWWWVTFQLALGPVAMGRLDAVVAPLCVVALAVGLRRPRVAAALLTAGAWVKVAPGALLLPLVVAVRRPGRTVVLPAAAVSAVVVGAVALGGGLSRIAGFVTTQGGRGLQVESVAATPWVITALVDDRVRIVFDTVLSTWEVTGPGTAATARALALALPVALAGLAALLVRSAASPVDVLLRGALAASATLLVVNAVGSPQLVGWLAAPVAVALTVAPDRRAWAPAAAGVLTLAALTQVVFPWGADGVVGGDPWVTAALVARNLGLVALLVGALRAVGGPRRVSRPAA
ncbi:hypothetical protein [Cellulomonas sp. ATA003]|uniref:hypothetical protein n=1 Tax=Cellulomonas sp. ATA003 TaxID=3073064 RepID=UPI0028736120|nr:hypothetical protein [Cellulomonas sp. ATA003]WNB85819.1 hypothetical protein REH70_00225 [Cellulomonas sp. ATA003]